MLAGLWNWLWRVQGREKQKFRGECANNEVQIHMQGSPSVTDRVSPRVGTQRMMSSALIH